MPSLKPAGTAMIGHPVGASPRTSWDEVGNKASNLARSPLQYLKVSAIMKKAAEQQVSRALSTGQRPGPGPMGNLPARNAAGLVLRLPGSEG